MNANEILKTLSGEAVRITVETNTLKEATLTYPNFTSLEDGMDADTIKGQVMFFDGVNTMGRDKQQLVRILKVEVFNHEWIEKFVALDLEYEYNEYVIGYVVTDKATGRSVNFQFEQAQSNHPQPAIQLTWGCTGDETHEVFSQEELDEISEWLRSHEDVREAEEIYETAYYVDNGASIADESAKGFGVYLSDMQNIAEQAE